MNWVKAQILFCALQAGDTHWPQLVVAMDRETATAQPSKWEELYERARGIYDRDYVAERWATMHIQFPEDAALEVIEKQLVNLAVPKSPTVARLLLCEAAEGHIQIVDAWDAATLRDNPEGWASSVKERRDSGAKLGSLDVDIARSMVNAALFPERYPLITPVQ